MNSDIRVTHKQKNLVLYFSRGGDEPAVLNSFGGDQLAGDFMDFTCRSPEPQPLPNSCGRRDGCAG